MNEPKLFVLSEHALTNIVDQLAPEHWNLEVPASIQPKKKMSLRELLNYHAYDDAWVPDTLSGKTIEEVGKKYDGDLLGEDPKGSWHAIVDKAVVSAEAVTDLEKKVHLTYGEYSTKEYFQHITMFRTFRTVDIARFLGLDDSLPEELVSGLWEILVPQAEALRNMGLFGPKVEVPEDASLYAKLMGLTGRQPK